jgi:hypothetical protein
LLDDRRLTFPSPEGQPTGSNFWVALLVFGLEKPIIIPFTK